MTSDNTSTVPDGWRLLAGGERIEVNDRILRRSGELDYTVREGFICNDSNPIQYVRYVGSVQEPVPDGWRLLVDDEIVNAEDKVWFNNKDYGPSDRVGLPYYLDRSVQYIRRVEPTPAPGVPAYYLAHINGELADMYAIAEAHNLHPALAHAVKYILRAGKKPGETASQAIDLAVGALGRAREMMG